MRVVGLDAATQARRQGDAARLRDIADRVERGEIIDWVIVHDDVANNCYERNASFQDRWRILGALEYARTAIHDNP